MSQNNGKSTTTVEQSPAEKSADREPYRPQASTADVQETIITSLCEVVYQATSNASSFALLARHYDKDKGTAVRYGHLVDAAECLEIALSYVAMVKSILSHQLRLEDDANIGDNDPWAYPRF